MDTALARKSTAWRDGTGGVETLEDEDLAYEGRWMSVAEVTETLDMLDGMAAVDEWERDDWWHPGWVPFLMTLSDDYRCVDLTGSFGGQPGQVLKFWHVAFVAAEAGPRPRRRPAQSSRR